MSDEFDEENDTGPHFVSKEARELAIVRSLTRNSTLLQLTIKRLDGYDDALKLAVAKLAECPVHVKTLEALVQDISEIKKRKSPSEEMKAADTKDEYLAKRIKRWWPILLLLIGAGGAGAGGSHLIGCGVQRDNGTATTALVRAFREAFREEGAATREALKKELRSSKSPTLHQDKED